MKNKKQLQTTTNRKEYKIISNPLRSDPYYDEGWGYHHTYTHKYSCKFWKKSLPFYKVRMYRTWKHNRKTQWKNTE